MNKVTVKEVREYKVGDFVSTSIEGDYLICIIIKEASKGYPPNAVVLFSKNNQIEVGAILEGFSSKKYMPFKGSITVE